MLVLSRKAGERLIIDANIVITVVQADDGRVRLGIEAPPHVRVVRQELLARGPDTPHDRRPTGVGQ